MVPPALGGQRGSGVTKDPSLPPLGPTLAQDFFTASQDDVDSRATGLAITIGAIVSLFVVMQMTARIEWGTSTAS